jgi:hypothetical protein
VVDAENYKREYSINFCSENGKGVHPKKVSFLPWIYHHNRVIVEY